MGATLAVKNWSEYQHYRDRSPAWIKLHKRLLDDRDFHCLPVASRALAPMIWLLASEHEGGKLPFDLEMFSFRLRQSEKEIESAINPLIDKGFLILEEFDSAPLVIGLQDAIPRREEKRRDASSENRSQPVEVVFRLPLISGMEYELPKTLAEQYAVAFPAVDVMAELRKMLAWLESNPKNRKTRNGITRYMNAWLSRAQNAAPVNGGSNGTYQQPSKAERREERARRVIEECREELFGNKRLGDGGSQSQAHGDTGQGDNASDVAAAVIASLRSGH
jgi:hypothetical protein